MPNHIHEIIVIHNKMVGKEYYSVPTGNKHYGLLSKIIKSFKHTCSKIIRLNFNNYRFQYQRSFYDHIIRNQESLNKIRKYIRENPTNWDSDKNNLNKYRSIPTDSVF